MDVRLIYDDIGRINTLPPKYYKILQAKGIKCAAFNPFRPIMSVIMNNRDHRKIFVVDGKVGFTEESILRTNILMWRHGLATGKIPESV